MTGYIGRPGPLSKANLYAHRHPRATRAVALVALALTTTGAFYFQPWQSVGMPAWLGGTTQGAAPKAAPVNVRTRAVVLACDTERPPRQVIRARDAGDIVTASGIAGRAKARGECADFPAGVVVTVTSPSEEVPEIIIGGQRFYAMRWQLELSPAPAAR